MMQKEEKPPKEEKPAGRIRQFAGWLKENLPARVIKHTEYVKVQMPTHYSQRRLPPKASEIKTEQNKKDDFVNFTADMVNSLKGVKPNSGDLISKMINVKEPLERGNYPTYPLLALINYCDLVAGYYGEPAHMLQKYANNLRSMLLGYKGFQWDKMVKMVPKQESVLNIASPQNAPIDNKKGFLSKLQKPHDELSDQ